MQALFLQSKEFFDQPANVKSEKWMNTKQQGYDYKESVLVSSCWTM